MNLLKPKIFNVPNTMAKNLVIYSLANGVPHMSSMNLLGIVFGFMFEHEPLKWEQIKVARIINTHLKFQTMVSINIKINHQAPKL